MLKQLIILYCLILLGCGQAMQTPQQMSLSWEKNDKGWGTREPAKWYFNGTYIGTGQDAFRTILTKIREAESGSVLFIKNKPLKITPSSPIFISHPYEDVFDEFVMVLMEKNIRVEREGYVEYHPELLSSREKIVAILLAKKHIQPAPPDTELDSYPFSLKELYDVSGKTPMPHTE